MATSPFQIIVFTVPHDNPIHWTPNDARLIAEHNIGRYERYDQILSDQITKTSGWLTASLLAINAGGALAALNAAERGPAATGPALVFGMGILTALLSAVTMQEFLIKMTGSVEQCLSYWRRVQISGVHDEQEARQVQEALKQTKKRRHIAPVIGWVSGIHFFIGAGLLAHTSQRLPQVDAVCSALQRDMLSSNPRRSDSRELFTALKCTPN